MIALNRLRDIQYNLTNANFSVRRIYSPPDAPVLEEDVQHLLAKELHEMRRGQYVLGREQEVADKKKPDICLGNPRCAGPVVIEVKIAESWSVAELEDGLARQLVGQYMRDRGSEYGIYVLCSSGPKHRWLLPDGARLTFEQLTARLAKEAAAIVEAMPSVRGLTVVPIDFHK